MMRIALAAGVLAALYSPQAGAQATEPLRVMRVTGIAGPLVNPEASYWQKAKAVTVAMQPQIIAPPQHPEPAVTQLSVKAVHNGQWLSFLIEWADKTKSDTIVLDRFGDQVAVQLPVKFDKASPPSPMMGNPDGGRVTILQWRAAFQRDIEKGEPTVRDLYPFAHVDVYPDQVLRATDARPYMGAIGVDNPISHPTRTPVLEQMAEGFGTLTTTLDSHAEGKGVWRNGRWRVVISHPLATESASDPRLTPGSETAAAFAVWEGGNREVGSRKAWADWTPVILDR